MKKYKNKKWVLASVEFSACCDLHLDKLFVKFVAS